MAQEPQQISFTLNGAACTVEVDPQMPLLFVLRDVLSLNATRFGCGEGTCGACAVIVDGRAGFSCDMPIESLAGKHIETAEGLDAAGYAPLIEAFLDHQAGQCGYCLSGILMAARAYIDGNGPPDRATIAAALNDHLCRCGAQDRILSAVETAATKMGKERTA